MVVQQSKQPGDDDLPSGKTVALWGGIFTGGCLVVFIVLLGFCLLGMKGCAAVGHYIFN